MTFVTWDCRGQTGWVRLGHMGPGIVWKGPAEPPLFSERMGFKRPWLRWRGWRLFGLGMVRQ